MTCKLKSTGTAAAPRGSSCRSERQQRGPRYAPQPRRSAARAPANRDRPKRRGRPPWRTAGPAERFDPRRKSPGRHPSSSRVGRSKKGGNGAVHCLALHVSQKTRRKEKRNVEKALGAFKRFY